MNQGLYVKRRESNLNQTEMAKTIGMHKQTYHLKESGKLEFRQSEMSLLARFFGCTLDELFGEVT